MINSLELVFWGAMSLVDKHFIRDVFEQKVTALDQAAYLIFLVYTGTIILSEGVSV